jgi:phosphoglycerate dehydrogenase-like enzyme
VTPVSLETLLRESRFVFVLAAPTVENRALLSREYLELLAPDSILILVSRAHVVDFDALTDLLVAGRFKAAIDVWPREPLDLNHPLRQAENVLLSSHRAGSVEEGLWEIGEMVLEDLALLARGLPPQRCARAEPEMIRRYASNNVPPADDAKVKKDLLS